MPHNQTVSTSFSFLNQYQVYARSGVLVLTTRGRKAPLKKVPWEIRVWTHFFGWSMEAFQLKLIPSVFKSLPNLSCPNLWLLPISPVLFWRHDNHFSGANCIPGGCRQCSVAEMWPKAQYWVNCSGVQMPPHCPDWKQPCSECKGHWHHTEPGDVEALCPHWGGITRASSTLPSPRKAFPLIPVSFSVSFILCLFQYFFCFLQFIWRGVTVRGRTGDAEGAGGAKEKTDFHHEEQALEDGEETLSAQVPSKMALSWGLCWLLSDALCLSLKLHICCCCNTTISAKVTSGTWPACLGSNDQS